jgi:hypothetical protein
MVHAPRLPATSQAWHCPEQAAVQQTPSVQNPLAHSFEPPQPAAIAFFATHWWLALQ